MTHNLSDPATENASPGLWPDVRTFAVAALIPFAAGLLVLLGYLILDGFFGGLLGAIVAGFAIFWWRNLNEKVFPAAIATKPVVYLAVANAALLASVLVLG